MKDINVATGIVPLGEFKAKASSLLKELSQSDELLVITQNGRPAAVLVSPAAFEEMRERHRYLEAVAVGIEDVEAGRVVEHDKVKAWLETWGSDEEGDAP